MHGRVKVRQTAEQKRIAEEKKAAKVAQFAALEKLTLSNFKKNSPDFLSNSAALLEANPNCFVFWNQRRLYLLENHLKNLPQEALLQEELKLTRICLTKDPKSYGAWFHRQWALEAFRIEDLRQELALCNYFLKLDERNFHCWDYRRDLVAKMELNKEEDEQFTSQLLDDNFSNFSAWHYRSEVLVPSERETRLAFEDDSGPFVPDAGELDLVHNAIFTDVKDQSAWFAYWRLFNDKRRLVTLNSVFLSREIGILCLKFSRNISCIEFDRLRVEVTGVESLIWTCSDPSNVSTLWICSLKDIPATFEVKIELNDVTKTFTLDPDVEEKMFQLNEEHLILQSSLCISPNIDRKILGQELEQLQMLNSMEPSNKWVLLTLTNIFAFLKSENYLEQTKKYIADLSMKDRQKAAYYQDLYSEILMNEAILNKSTNLSNMGLTCIPNVDALYHLKSLNLSENKIKSVPDSLRSLVCLKSLNLANNLIKSLAKLPALLSLEELIVKGNPLEKPDKDAEMVKEINTALKKLEL